MQTRQPRMIKIIRTQIQSMQLIELLQRRQKMPSRLRIKRTLLQTQLLHAIIATLPYHLFISPYIPPQIFLQDHFTKLLAPLLPQWILIHLQMRKISLFHQRKYLPAFNGQIVLGQVQTDNARVFIVENPL